MLWRTLKEKQEFVGLENSHGTGQQSSGETEREMYISFVKVPCTNLPEEIVLVEPAQTPTRKAMNPTTSEKLFYCQFIGEAPAQISYSRDQICQRLTYVRVQVPKAQMASHTTTARLNTALLGFKTSIKIPKS